jgi:hypothetical protein
MTHKNLDLYLKTKYNGLKTAEIKDDECENVAEQSFD